MVDPSLMKSNNSKTNENNISHNHDDYLSSASFPRVKENNNIMFFPSSKLKLLHQRSSLSFAYDVDRGWGYCGETALYVIAAVKNDGRKGNEGYQKTRSSDGTRIGQQEDEEQLCNNNKNIFDNCSTKNSTQKNYFDSKTDATIELGCHLRDGCKVDSVEVFGAFRRVTTPASIKNGTDKITSDDAIDKGEEISELTKPNNKGKGKSAPSNTVKPMFKGNVKDSSIVNGEKAIYNDERESSIINSTMQAESAVVDARLLPLPNHTISYCHHDPLTVFLTRPISLRSAEANDLAELESSNEINNKSSRRYEADSHASRGTRGMISSLRAASISSALGELRIRIVPSKDNDTSSQKDVKKNNSSEKNNAHCSFFHPVTRSEAIKCWKDDLLVSVPASTSSIGNCADQDVSNSMAAGEGSQGTIVRGMVNDMVKWRCRLRREARLDLVAKAMADASGIPDSPSDTALPISSSGLFDDNKNSLNIFPAMKIVIRFSLRRPEVPPTAVAASTVLSNRSVPSASTPPPVMKSIGGLNFVSPQTQSYNRGQEPSSCLTPHVYTVSGTHGDHQGVRSWLPTLDSASPLHRSSHELTIKVTSLKDEGLWSCSSGEDFGHNQSVAHPFLGFKAREAILENMRRESSADNDIDQDAISEVERVWDAMDVSISEALGMQHAQFLNDFFNGSFSEKPYDRKRVVKNRTPDYAVDLPKIKAGLMSQLRQLQPTYVTSICSSLIWSPCPSRSLGYAVGPFAVLYDPEYYHLDVDDEENDMDDDAEEDRSPLSIHDTAKRLGEGIRQLYFAPLDDRPWIHADVNDDLIFGSDVLLPIYRSRPRSEPTPAVLLEKRLVEGSVLWSTIGVPNRALSLMRDILALPAYRTSSYTQVWIPDAHLSGSNNGGNMVGCPEVGGCNYFLGGAIIDSALLPPPGMRLPFYNEGRALQFIQARNAIRGWVRSALPLGGDDDVGQGYLHVLVETFIMSLYERGHGAFGEGGGKGSSFYTKRYAIGSGLNSPNLDFLPLVNIEDDEVVGSGLGTVAIEERGNEHLWRSASNGTESHTSSIDEFTVGQLLAKDLIEALERSDKAVPLPSMGWQGSHQSVTFLTHNSSSSTALGCGALELVHPMGGQMYRALKTILLNRVYENRATVSHLTRVVRAAFIAIFLRDSGVYGVSSSISEGSDNKEIELNASRPPFTVCVDEIVKKEALTHSIFTRALRVMSGPIHEAHLRGNLVDIERENNRSNKILVAPEGFPNAYVLGASGLYMRVGVHVEAADGGLQTASVSQSAAAVKGIQLHVVVEPVIPEGGSTFAGPVTMRVIENEGQCREFIKTIPDDGSRAEWGPVFLHARPVSTIKQQQAASGISDASSTDAAASGSTTEVGVASEIIGGRSGTAFTKDHLHRGGFQALELIRITNATPLLWVRVDPHGIYNGRFHIFQQEACLAEQLFHDGDAAAQVEAVRALAERPLKIQSPSKLTNVHEVSISELPVRVLGDCLRGSVALHCDLPHNPAVRAQAALAIAQWQNNKAPESRDVVGGSSWLGLDLLMQYFKERFCHNGFILPINFRRVVLHKHIAGGATCDATSDGGYQYLDTLRDKDERKSAIEFADEVEIEEDEEYRVRSACITAICAIRAQDGMTPPSILSFMDDVLHSGDKAAQGSLLLSEEEELLKKKQDLALDDELGKYRRIIGPNDSDVSNLPYISLSLMADALLSLCYIHVRPEFDFDPTTNRPLQVKEGHPILPLMKSCREWLDWDLEREKIRSYSCTSHSTGVGSGCYGNIAPCAITALCHMTLLKQITSIDVPVPEEAKNDKTLLGSKRKCIQNEIEESSFAQFYVELFDNYPRRVDTTRAAAAQAVVCIVCAADQIEVIGKEPLGLLLSLEFLLDRIVAHDTSPGLRLTLALLMMDACTGKICSLQRVASFCCQRNLTASGLRFMNGPLGSSYGGDNGSALLLTVSDTTYPAANAVNDGARRGLRLLRDNCKDGAYSNQTIVRVATFASRLWRTINGEKSIQNQTILTSLTTSGYVACCAHDSHLRCALIALWQWIWPRFCYQLMRAQSWHAMEGTPQYYAMGLDNLMKTTMEEKEAASLEDQALMPLTQLVENEIDKQKLRGEISAKAFEYFQKENKNSSEIGQPLPMVEKDSAWKLGGWVASTAQQRRAQGVDGGSAVTKIRLMVKNSVVENSPNNT